MNEEQKRIEMRQVDNIYKMMKTGDKGESEGKRREASPFINYAMDYYNIPRDEQSKEVSQSESSVTDNAPEPTYEKQKSIAISLSKTISKDVKFNLNEKETPKTTKN